VRSVYLSLREIVVELCDYRLIVSRRLYDLTHPIDFVGDYEDAASFFHSSPVEQFSDEY
jgi:hypothetical protein